MMIDGTSDGASDGCVVTTVPGLGWNDGEGLVDGSVDGDVDTDGENDTEGGEDVSCN